MSRMGKKEDYGRLETRLLTKEKKYILTVGLDCTLVDEVCSDGARDCQRNQS